MTLEVIALSQLLQVIYANDKRRKELFRRKIYSERKKAAGLSTSTGGDFYVPFWADVKRHIAGEHDLRTATKARIAKNRRLTRLYNIFSEQFLIWWEERRRLRNEPFTIIHERINARLELKGLGVIKVENTLSITVGDDGHRVFYPYLCEEPVLSNEAARVGLWVMSQSITGYAAEDMRVLDVMQGRSFSIIDTPLHGDEESILRNQYDQAIASFEDFRKKYET